MQKCLNELMFSARSYVGSATEYHIHRPAPPAAAPPAAADLCKECAEDNAAMKKSGKGYCFSYIGKSTNCRRHHPVAAEKEGGVGGEKKKAPSPPSPQLPNPAAAIAPYAAASTSWGVWRK